MSSRVLAQSTHTMLIDDFFFNDTATTEIYTLSLHDALPIFIARVGGSADLAVAAERRHAHAGAGAQHGHRDMRHLLLLRSEEHTSELQSLAYLVCRLLLEKKKTRDNSRLLVTLSRFRHHPRQ